MRFLFIALPFTLAMFVEGAAACGRPFSPNDIEPGVVAVDSVCTFLEGVTDNGTVASICATTEELGKIATLLSPLFGSDSRPEGGCQLIPRSYICATREQLGPAIQRIIADRRARLLFDGGMP